MKFSLSLPHEQTECSTTGVDKLRNTRDLPRIEPMNRSKVASAGLCPEWTQTMEFLAAYPPLETLMAASARVGGARLPSSETWIVQASDDGIERRLGQPPSSCGTNIPCMHPKNSLSRCANIIIERSLLTYFSHTGDWCTPLNGDEVMMLLVRCGVVCKNIARYMQNPFPILFGDIARVYSQTNLTTFHVRLCMMHLVQERRNFLERQRYC